MASPRGAPTRIRRLAFCPLALRSVPSVLLAAGVACVSPPVVAPPATRAKYANGLVVLPAGAPPTRQIWSLSALLVLTAVEFAISIAAFSSTFSASKKGVCAVCRFAATAWHPAATRRAHPLGMREHREQIRARICEQCQKGACTHLTLTPSRTLDRRSGRIRCGQDVHLDSLPVRLRPHHRVDGLGSRHCHLLYCLQSGLDLRGADALQCPLHGRVFCRRRGILRGLPG